MNLDAISAWSPLGGTLTQISRFIGISDILSVSFSPVSFKDNFEYIQQMWRELGIKIVYLLLYSS